VFCKSLVCAFLAFVFCAAGCASSKKNEQKDIYLEEINCPSGSIKGIGIGENEQEALTQARTAISSQIKLSITVESEQNERQFLSESKEISEMEFNSQVKQATELLNAQDARLQATKIIGDKIGAVACMSREDAAKPYLNELRQINDSLGVAIKTVLAQTHPRTKKEAAKAAENLKMRQVIAVQVLQGLEKYVEQQENEPYEEMLKNYGEFSSEFKIIWLGENEQIFQTLAAKISSRYKIETGACVYGLKLIPISTDIYCENNGSYGHQCSFLPALEGRSCTDELYFTLKGQMVRGTGKKDYNEAMRKLLALIPNAPFWHKWFEEMDKYVCYK
jgi:hypothetical protein